MRVVAGLALVASVVLSSGCASQKPVQLSMERLSTETTKVGVVLATLPKADTSFPGANCLLCLAAAAVANQSLTIYAGTLPSDDLASLPNDIATRLRARGIDARPIEERIALASLPSLARATDQPERDLTSVGTKYGVDKLLVIEIALLGFQRTYSAYVPTDEPKGFVAGRGYLIDLKTQKYEWFQNIRVQRAAEGAWDEPPKFPGLTNAYFQAIEASKDRFMEVFQDAKR